MDRSQFFDLNQCEERIVLYNLVCSLRGVDESISLVVTSLRFTVVLGECRFVHLGLQVRHGFNAGFELL